MSRPRRRSCHSAPASVNVANAGRGGGGRWCGGLRLAAGSRLGCLVGGSGLRSGLGARRRPVRARSWAHSTRRRARARYSGPCLRGSAYSFGLTVQCVPEVVPYHVPPLHSGSQSTASS